MNVTEFWDVTSLVDTETMATTGLDDMVTVTDVLGAMTSTAMPETTGSDWGWLGNIVMKSTTGKGTFLGAFIASLSFIIVSELGDKTFFIAAIMAMKHPRLIVFSGAISALVFMTVLSVAFGSIASFIPRVYTYYAGAVLFAIFGLKMLWDGWRMKPNEGQEELEEVQMELKKREDEEEQEEEVDMVEQGKAENRAKRKALFKVFLSAASLTFVAEWGDRSQLATVVLAMTEDVFGVVIGGALGHALCTGLAVIGGRMLAQKISVRTVTIIGGLVFLIFAVSALFIDPGE